MLGTWSDIQSFCKKAIFLLAFTSLAFLSPNSAQGATSGITYHGRLVEPDDTTPVSGVVQFKLQIRTPDSSDCLLYEEWQSVDLTGTNGIFALTINDGTYTYHNPASLPIDQVFANRGTYTFAAGLCVGANTYTPGVGDGRVLRVTFQSASMSAEEPMPSTLLNFAPQAIEAQQVSGFQAANLLRFAKSDGTLVNTSPLNDVEYAALVALVDGTSSLYAKAGNATNGTPIYSTSGTIGSTNVGDMWLDTTTPGADVLKINTDSGVESIALSPTGSFINSVTAGTGVTVSTAGGTATVGVANGGITSTQIASGTITGGNLNSGIVIATTGTVSAAGIGTRSLGISNAQAPTANTVNITAPSAAFTNYGMVLPASLGNTGYVLSVTDQTTGQLGWIPSSTGSVTSVSAAATAGNPLVIGGTAAAPTIDIPPASLTQNGYLSTASYSTFMAKASGTLASANLYVGNSSNIATGVPLTGDATLNNTGLLRVVRLQGVGIGSSAPTSAGQTLRYDGSQYNAAFLSMNDIRSTTMPGLTIFPTSSCAASKSLNWNSLVDQFTCADIAISSSQVSGLGTAALLNVGTGSNSVVQLDGSGKLPAIDGSALTNLNASALTTGVLSPARLPASATFWQDAGSGKIDYNGGAVGIGTSTPTGLLQVAGGTNGFYQTTSDFVIGSIGSGLSIKTGSAVGDTYSSLQAFSSGNTVSNNLILQASGGNVGIGTTAPGSPLTVAGVIQSTSGGVKFPDGTTQTTAASGAANTFIQNGNAFGAAAVLGTTDSYAVGLMTNSTRRVTIDTSGNVGIGTTVPSQALEVVGSAKLSGGLIAGKMYPQADSAAGLQFNKANGTTNVMDIDTTNGRVGIGTTAPSYPLDVVGQVNSSTGFSIAGVPISASGSSIWALNATNAYNTNSGNVGIGTDAPASPFAVNGGAAFGTYATTAAPTNGLIVSGNVGIGTTSPASPLTVAGVIQSTSGGIKFPDGTTQTTAASGAANTFIQNGNAFGATAVLGTTDSNVVGIITNGTRKVTIDTSGNVGIGTTAPTNKFEVAGGNIAIGYGYGIQATGSPNTNVLTTSWNGSSDTLNLYTPGNNRSAPVVTMLSLGNVGIGTTAPGASLDVTPSANTIALQSTGQSLTGASAQSLVNLGGTWNTAGTPTLIKANVVDTASNSASLLMDLQVGGTSKFKVDKTGKITGDGSGLTGVVAGATSLSSLTAATATNTIDNLLNAQTWSWSTASTQTPLTINANALTTGSLLSLSSSNASLNSTNGLLNVANTGASTAGLVAKIQANSTPGSGLYVLATGNVGIGTTAPASPLTVAGVIQSTSGGIKFPDGTTQTTASTGSATPSLSALSAATAINTIDSLNFAQNWNWSTAAGQTPLSMNANALTTGSILSIASSNASLNSANGLLSVANTGASTSGLVAKIQSNSAAGSGLYVLASGNVGIGTTAPSQALELVGNAKLSGALIAGKMYPSADAVSGVQFNKANGITNVMDIDTTNARVGVGTTAPAYPLDVVGQINSSTGFSIAGVPVSASGSSIWALNLTNAYNTNTGNVGIGTDAPASPLSVSGGASFGTYATTAAPLNGLIVSGNVGIGTTAPAAKLEVSGTSAGGALKLDSGDSNMAAGGWTQIAFGYNGTTQYPSFIRTRHNNTAPNNAIDFYTSDGTAAGVFPTNAVLGMSINNGSVGIGTTAPGQKLSVAGTIESTMGGIKFPDGTTQTTASTGSAAPALSAISAATATNTIDSLNFAQTWNWSTTSTQTAFTLNANALTTGSALSIASSNPGLNSANGLLNVANTGPSTSGWVARIQANSTAGSGLYVTASGNVGIGTAGPLATLQLKAGSAQAFTAPLKLTAGTNLTTPEAGAIEYDGTNLYYTDNTNTRKTLGIAGAGGGALSALTAATATNTIDNLNFAQTWNWSTAAGQTPLTVNANALTTGSVLSIASSNATLNSINGLLSVANTGASTSGMIARIQSNSTAGSGLSVLASGFVGIGTTTPAYKLDVVGDYVRASNFRTAGQYLATNANPAAPSFSSNISSNTGLFFPAVNNIGFAINGTESVHIDSSGNLGIGTTAPANALDIGTGGGIHITSGTPSSTTAALYNNAGTLTWNGVALNSGSPGIGGSGTTNYLPIYTAANTLGSSPVYATGGNVGIGTTAPSSLLHIVSSAATTMATIANSSNGTALNISTGSNGTAMTVTSMSGTGISVNGNSGTGVYASSSSKAFYGYGQNGGTAIYASGAPNSGSFSGTGIYTEETGSNTGYAIQAVNNSSTGWGVYANGTSPSYFAGNVGIGTTAPAYKLDVAGAINATSLLVNGVAVGTGGSSPWTTYGSNIANNNSGNVGIGTTAPASLLANSAVLTADAVASNGVGPSSLSWVTSWPGYTAAFNNTGTSSYAHGVLIKTAATASAARALEVDSGSGAKLIVQADGNVGIGTTAPAYNLDVAGTINATAVKINGASLSAAQPYIMGGTFLGTSAASQIFMQHPFPIAVTIPAGCTNSRFEFATAATASTTISLQKCTGAGFTSCTQFGTAVVSASGNVATFTCASATTFAAGTDSLLITGPLAPTQPPPTQDGPSMEQGNRGIL